MSIHSIIQIIFLIVFALSPVVSGCGSQVAFEETGSYYGEDQAAVELQPESEDATAATNEPAEIPPDTAPKSDVVDAKDATPPDEKKTDLEETVANDGLVNLCDDAKRVVTKEMEIDFPSTVGMGCDIKDAKIKANMTAYRRQNRDIEIPTGALLCVFDLKTEEQEVIYDDELLMTFNDFFLAGANHTSEVLEGFGMEKQGELVKWDWAKHYNTKRDHDEGGCSLSVDCEFPMTQTKGTVSVNIPSSWLEQLPMQQQSQQKFTLSVITTGNQNSSTDCSHTGLKFKSTIKYVIPE